jgi:hypothetical protein
LGANSVLFGLFLLAAVFLTLFTNWRRAAKRKVTKDRQDAYVSVIEENTLSINKNSQLMEKILTKLDKKDDHDQGNHSSDSGAIDTGLH